MDNYSTFDHPHILSRLFYPRRDDSPSTADPSILEFAIPVAPGIDIGSKFFISQKESPSILFFHGNGEIVSDYDDLGPLFTEMGINFIPVDYRGYGRSGGTPSVSFMMSDCHAIYRHIRNYFDENGFTGSLFIMGRSLGSASALELASSYPDSFSGLIIDSGFAFALPLLRVIGVNPDLLGISEGEGFRNYDKIKKFPRPTLIIHARHDQIIPFPEGQKLYDSSPAKKKHMLAIAEADHNTIFMYGLREYLSAIKSLVFSNQDDR